MNRGVTKVRANQYGFTIRMDSARQRFYRVKAGP